MYNTNALGPLRVAQALLAHGMLKNSVMVFISSGASNITRAQGYARNHAFSTINLGYNMSKAASNLAAMTVGSIIADTTRTIAVDPGWMQTRMGGPNAKISPAYAAEKIIDLVHSQGGHNHIASVDGDEIPW